MREPVRSAGRWLLLTLVLIAAILTGGQRLAAQAPGDTDGDGVADAADCNPADARVASPHTYYFDLDGDMSGNAGDPATLCSATPFPGTALWHGDPDDADPSRRGTVHPRGTRRLAVDFGDTAAGGTWRPDLARELGADATTLHLLWNQIETAPGSFDGPQVALLNIVAAAYREQGYSINLTLSPLSQLYLTVPADLAAALQAGTLTFESPAFIARFQAFMDFVHWRLDGLPVDALQIGHEVDRYLTIRPDGAFWGQFANFFNSAKAHAKARWGASLSVGMTATANGIVVSPASVLMSAINVLSDHVSVTYLSRSATFEAAAAANVRAEIQGLVAAAYPKPLVFQSVGAPSAVAALSSTAEQAQFFEAFFAAWDEYRDHIPFVSIAQLFDWSPARAAAEASSAHVAAGAALPAATAFFGSLGLRDHAGNAKAAYDAVRMLALERGWWRDPLQTTRSTLVGFTPALYDRDGTAIDDEVLANVMGRIGESADLALFQFDNGVPWTEALTDTGTGPLPYSPGVRDTWEKYRAARPAGTRLAVALNPIGVPRRMLAPYWGVGEDFVYDANFQPVGTGRIRDFESRLLPPEWQNRQWDDPAVKTAFTSYAKRAVQFFSPDYLIIAIEANLALEPDPAKYAQFVALQRHVYEALKADPATAHVPIVVSFVAEHFLLDRLGMHYLIDGVADAAALQQLHLGALAQSAPYLDMVGLSTYPLKTRFGTSRPAASLFDHLMTTVRSVTSKPAAITETGFPAASFTVRNQVFQSSPEKQAQFYRLLFAEAEKYALEFVVSYTPYDMTPFMDRLRAGAAQDPPEVDPDLVEFFKYFEFMGLFDLDGSARPAGDFLSDYVARSLVREDSWVAPVQITSPSGTVSAEISVDGSGALSYTIGRAGQRQIDPSPLGLIVEETNLGSQVTNIELSAVTTVDETYPTRGVHKVARNRHTRALLTVRRSPATDRTVNIEFRVFDDGVAYRYQVPGDAPRTITGEASAWMFPEGSRVWHQVNTENYEANYRGSTLGFFNDDVGGPVTAEVPGGGYLLLTEAALLAYSGMTYDFDLGSRMLRGEFLDTTAWQVPPGATSPWRVVLTTATLNDLVNSDVVTSLNPPPDPALFPRGQDTWWIKPGRAVWSWWSDSTSGYNYDVQHAYIDLAHTLRAEYQVIDAGWEQAFPAGDQDAFQRLAALSAYSRIQWRDVGLWVWKYWYELVDPVARNTFFAKVAQAGAVGVKIDNVYGYQSESFSNVELTAAILRDAAAHRLMVNFHGVGKSTGLQRTYPNEVTREGFMGLELNGLAWDQGLFVAPEHNAAAPFVRLAIGPGDYTPVTLDAGKIGKTTFGHQLATAGVFTSPMQHWADHPNVILQQPIAVDLLRTIPVDWEETRVLPPSQIGRLAMFARRAAGRWYLFAINGDEASPRALSVPLDFLGPGRWNATIITEDGRTALAQSSVTGLTAASSTGISMLAGGGFAAVFSPAPDLARPVLQGFSSVMPSFTGEGFQQGYSTLRDHADIVLHSLQEGVPWPEALASSDPATYSAHLQGYWNLLRSADQAVIPEKPRYLMLNPIETVSYARLAPYMGERDYMPLPAPWDTYDFNHPNVKQAFVNYAIAAVEFFQPSYLAIGVEANILLANAPQKWEAYKEFNAHVYAALKARYPSLVVLTSVHYEQMLGLFKESETLAAQLKDSYPNVLVNEVISLLQHSDMLALSTYPFMAENNILIGPSTRLDPDYYDTAVAIASAIGKPLGVEQTGYITRDLYAEARDVTLPGSEERQRAFIERILTDAHVNNFTFMLNFVAVDYGLNYGTHPTTLTWAYTGLKRQDMTSRPAMAVWDAFRTESTGGGGGGSGGGVGPAAMFQAFAASAGAAAGAGSLPPVGSIFESPTPELFIRWQQFASLFPDFEEPPVSDPTSPWGFGEPYRSAAQAALARREAFLPYLQPLFDAFDLTGVFALTLVSDPETPVYMLGDWVLVAPVVTQGATTRQVALPAGSRWLNWYTGELHDGNQTIEVAAPLDRMPIFIRSIQ